ncbi:MAG: D-alanyl-D-alanine carboxypeptidase family protein [Paracoccaceae bacterium]
MATFQAQCVRSAVQAILFALALAIAPVAAFAAPFAALVMDARTGEVLYETNADTRLHPASLTKMMTLYVAFQAIERGEISLDTMVKVSAHAAGQSPSKLGLRPGQRIALRYLIRAAAIKSANDAATAIGEAISGSEPAFARRMTRTAKALGMTRTTFKNANGLTATGHLSTARDMTVLGRHLFYDFPQYYGIFSRRTADAGVAQVSSTNRRFLDSYKGADGIKTGYTVPAGFNLTASAERGKKRIIATILGGKSTVSRNAKMAELLDKGFALAPNRVIEQKPRPPAPADEPAEMLLAEAGVADDDAPLAAAVSASTAVDADMNDAADGPAAAKTLRVTLAVMTSSRPAARPSAAAAPVVAAAGPGLTGAPPAAPDGPATGIATEIAAAPAVPEGPVFVQTATPQPETLALAASGAETMTPVDPAAADALAEAVAGEGVAVIDPTEPAPASEPAPAPLAIAAIPAPAGAAPEPAEDAVADALGGAGEIDDAVLLALADAGEPAATSAMRPSPRPGTVLPAAETALALAAPAETVPTGDPAPEPSVEPAALRPAPEAPEIILAASDEPAPQAADLEVVTRVSTSGGRQWGVTIGNYSSRFEAERVLIRTALIEMTTLDEALRKVVPHSGGFDANFVGMTEESAELACRRLIARATDCAVIGPTG